ncbi:MAG TPA: MATE family efflux transporter [Myxococcota bacterium]|nr:MATE family efflux transporter [Myxococcota bacterium]
MTVPAQTQTLPETPAAARGAVGEVLNLALPVVAATLSETTMQFIDTAMLGHLGTVPLGAAGFAGLWIWTLFVPFTGIAQGVQAFTSRHDGAGEPERCGAWIWQATWLLVPAMTLWMFAVAWLFPLLVALIRPSPELQAAAISYGFARLPGGPAVVMNFIIASFYRGIGDTRTPLLVTLGGVLVHLFFAYGLIFGGFGLPAWGVVGAAAAQSIGSWTFLVLYLACLFRPSTRRRYRTLPVRPRWDESVRFLRTSAAIGGQWLLDMITFAIFASIVARMGDVAMAASQAMLQCLAFSFMQVYAISIACSTLVGRYIGAGDLDSAERSYRSSLVLGMGVTVLVALVFVTLPEVLLRFFNGEPEFLAQGRPLLALGAFFQVADAVGIVAGGALRGAGDTRFPFVVQSVLSWTLRLGSVWTLAVYLQGGVFGAWTGELLYVTALAFCWVLRFRAGHWRTVRI